MIESLISYLHIHIIPLGAMGVFIAALVQEIFPPIPSALVILASGFIFLTEINGLDALLIIFFKISIPAAIGITLGSLLIFALSYLLGKPFIDRYGKLIGIFWFDIEKLEKWMERGIRDDMIIFISRAIPIIPSIVIGASAGLLRLPLRTYIISSFLGSLVRSFILGILGWQIGNLYVKYSLVISRLENYIFVGLAFLILCWIFVQYRRKKGRDII